MHSIAHSAVRTALFAGVLLIPTARTVSANPVPFQAAFSTQFHLEWDLAHGLILPRIAGTGWASTMEGPVICLSSNQEGDMGNTWGRATYSLRDTHGAMIVVQLEMVPDAIPISAHMVTFGGTFEVTLGTGSFAGATGAGHFSGWADFDLSPATLSPQGMPLFGKGYWEMDGTIVVPSATGEPCLHVSSRAHVGSGELTHIVGLEVSSSVPRAYLIRGVGPTLASYGLTGALVDPVVTVYNGASQVVGANDDWSAQTPDVVSAIRAATAAVGAFTLSDGSKDAALLLALPAGSYTVHLAGKDGGTGIGLVEILEVP